MSTPQEYWDALLVRGWRNSTSIKDTIDAFKSITGVDPREHQPPLLRVPSSFIKYNATMRWFVGTYLWSLNDLFWNTPPDKDTELFKRVSKSKADTTKTRHRTAGDKEVARLQQKTRNDKQRLQFQREALGFDNRNRSTNWNVTK